MGRRADHQNLHVVGAPRVRANQACHERQQTRRHLQLSSEAREQEGPAGIKNCKDWANIKARRKIHVGRIEGSSIRRTRDLAYFHILTTGRAMQLLTTNQITHAFFSPHAPEGRGDNYMLSWRTFGSLWRLGVLSINPKHPERPTFFINAIVTLMTLLGRVYDIFWS